MCLHASSSNKHSKSLLHCHSHILIWVVERCCVGFCLHSVPLSSFEVRRCLQHTSFSTVPRKYVRLMSLSCTSNDKLADIMTETSTLLVESTNSSVKDVRATRLCRTRRFSRLALEQFHKHLRNVLHQPPLVPQSHTTFLIPASSISSVISSV